MSNHNIGLVCSSVHCGIPRRRVERVKWVKTYKDLIYISHDYFSYSRNLGNLVDPEPRTWNELKEQGHLRQPQPPKIVQNRCSCWATVENASDPLTGCDLLDDAVCCCPGSASDMKDIGGDTQVCSDVLLFILATSSLTPHRDYYKLSWLSETS